jgi:hypothetical protein
MKRRIIFILLLILGVPLALLALGGLGSGTPQRLHVQGTIAFPSSAGVTPVTFERVCELDASRRIVAGSFTWHF